MPISFIAMDTAVCFQTIHIFRLCLDVCFFSPTKRTRFCQLYVYW